MKKIFILGLVVLCWCVPGTGFAAQSFSVPVNVQVPMMLELDYWIRSCPGDSTPYGAGAMDVRDMNFGQLVWNDQNRIWLADKYFTVFMVAMTSGRPYQLSQTCNGFVSPSSGTTLNSTLLMTPDYKQEDRWTASDPATAQGAMPSGDRLGNKDLAVGVDKIIYDSFSGIGPRIIRSYYGLATGDPAAREPTAAKVLTGQAPAGDYSGTITFSLMLR